MDWITGKEKRKLKSGMKQIRINILISLVLVIVAVILTSSWLHGNFTLFSRGWIWLAIGCLICTIQYPAYYKQKNNFWLIVYAIIIVFNYLLGDGFFHSPVNLIMEIAMLLFCSYFSFFVINDSDSGWFNNLFIYSQILVILFTSILSISVDIAIPGVIRDTVSLVNAGYSSDAIPFYRMGVCEYAFPHSIPMVIPGIVLLLKNKRLKLFYRGIAAALVVLLLYLVFVSGVTTSLILTLFGIPASIFAVEGNAKKNATRIILFIVLLTPLLNDSVMLKVLNVAEQIVPEENKITGKILNFEESIQNENADGSLQQRGDLYRMSLDAFISNPILGTDDKPLGGHSALLDRLGTLGLLGIIPFMSFIISLYKMIKYRLPSHSRMFFYIGMAGFIIMLATKNMNNIYVWLYSMCLLPALILFNSNPPKFLLRH